MKILAVDLAAKYSAACLMDDERVVVDQWDSWQLSETRFVNSLLEPFTTASRSPALCVIEDLPHRMPFNGTTKTVSRLQGRIYQHLSSYDLTDKIIFVSPDTWRNTYPALRKRGSGPEAVLDVCAELGYTPPDFTERAKGHGGKTLARKVATDYCAAYLIARWAWRMQILDFPDPPGTSRYGQQQTRKVAA